MPDVNITCPSCGKTITVSEFVDLSKLVCRSCGGLFTAPEPEPAEEEETVGQAAAQHAPPPEAAKPEPAVVVAKVVPRPRKRFRWTYQIKCWAVFTAVGLAALVIRYCGVLGKDSLDALIAYGPLAVLGMHFYVTFRAFHDSILAGVLCLLVPFYSMYYVFWTLEDYMFRAVFAGILAGTGADTLAWMYEHGAEILPWINDFLTSL